MAIFVFSYSEDTRNPYKCLCCFLIYGDIIKEALGTLPHGIPFLFRGMTDKLIIHLYLYIRQLIFSSAGVSVILGKQLTGVINAEI